MIKDFTTYINEGLFDRNQSEFVIRKTDNGIEQVYVPKTKEELYKYIDIDIEQAKKDGTYPNVNLNNIDISELGDYELGSFLFSDIYNQINPDIANWDIKSIPSYFFASNKQIKEFIIPNSVTNIRSGAFHDCSNLTKTNYTGDIAGWCGINFESWTSNPTSYSCNLYINDDEVKDLVIPNSVKNIGSYAFYMCIGLTSVTIGNSVTSIGDQAFYYCSGMTSVTIGNSVMIIGKEAFEYCSSLTSVTIPNSVTSIGQYAFHNCDHLTSVTIGKSVTSIGRVTFYECTNLTKTNYIGDIAGWCGINFGGWCSNPTKYSHNLYINDVEVKDLVIPNSVTSIGDYAFEGCSGITSVTIPNSVTSIGDWAFKNCSDITSVTIPNSVISIGDYAFEGCYSLTSVTISKYCSIESSSFPSDCKIIIK